MKLGLIADIHGSKPALEAVLESAPRVVFWVCMGDVVGYYPDVNEVCEILIGINATVVRGNHDAYVLGQLPTDTGKMELYRTAWTRKRLKPEYCQWLSILPVEMNLCLGQKEFKIRHASPWDEETYLYADSPALSTDPPGARSASPRMRDCFHGPRRLAKQTPTVHPQALRPTSPP